MADRVLLLPPAEHVLGQWQQQQQTPSPLHSRRYNFIKVTLSMVVIVLISSSLAQAGWIRVSRAPGCPEDLAPYLFFDVGTFTSVVLPSGLTVYLYHCEHGTLECLNPTFVVLVRCVIVASFLAILAAFGCFAMDSIKPRGPLASLVRKCALFPVLMETCLLFAIVFTSLAQSELGASVSKVHHTSRISYEYGFWTLVAAATFSTLAVLLLILQQCSRMCGGSLGGNALQEDNGSGTGVGDRYSDPNAPPPSYSESVAREQALARAQSQVIETVAPPASAPAAVSAAPPPPPYTP